MLVRLTPPLAPATNLVWKDQGLQWTWVARTQRGGPLVVGQATSKSNNFLEPLQRRTPLLPPLQPGPWTKSTATLSSTVCWGWPARLTMLKPPLAFLHLNYSPGLFTISILLLISFLQSRIIMKNVVFYKHIIQESHTTAFKFCRLAHLLNKLLMSKINLHISSNFFKLLCIGKRCFQPEVSKSLQFMCFISWAPMLVHITSWTGF